MWGKHSRPIYGDRPCWCRLRNRFGNLHLLFYISLILLSEKPRKSAPYVGSPQ